MSCRRKASHGGGYGGINTVWEISTYPTFNLKKGHDRHGASLQTPPNKQLPFKTRPISSLRDHRATIGRNLVFLRGFSENSFAFLINRARARRRARARMAQLARPAALSWTRY